MFKKAAYLQTLFVRIVINLCNNKAQLNNLHPSAAYSKGPKSHTLNFKPSSVLCTFKPGGFKAVHAANSTTADTVIPPILRNKAWSGSLTRRFVPIENITDILPKVKVEIISVKQV